MLVSRYFLWFLLYSFCGWLFEAVYCTITSGRWENRGFLYGPICPIYGVGAVGITFLYRLVYHCTGVQDFTWWQIFLVGFLGSIPLEFGTSWILEKLFHAYWWDYSDMPFNLQGRVCLPAAALFGISGVVIIQGITPRLSRLTSHLSPILVEMLALLAMALLAADLTLTVSVMTRFANIVSMTEERLNQHMENFVLNLQEKGQGVAQDFQGIRQEAARNLQEKGRGAARNFQEKGRGAARNFQEKRQEATQNIQDMRQDIALKLQEERQRFSLEIVEELAGQMGGQATEFYWTALKRVQGVRLPHPENTRELAVSVMEMVKKHTPFYRKKKAQNPVSGTEVRAPGDEEDSHEA